MYFERGVLYQKLRSYRRAEGDRPRSPRLTEASTPPPSQVSRLTRRLAERRSDLGQAQAAVQDAEARRERW
ncbi:MAG: hypothetical protein U0935_19015 [Pirellulales bacterium]